MKRFILLSVCVIFFSTQLLSQTIRYVKADGTTSAANAAQAMSWATACNDLQAVINISATGDVIWVAKGTYKPNRPANNLTVVNAANRDNAFVLKSGIKIYGGFTGSETEFEQRVLPEAMENYGSILSGDIGSVGDNADNCYHVVISAGNIVAACLDGFIITGGNANNSESISVNGYNITRNRGGGICNINSSPVLTNIVICNNTATNRAGGIYNDASSSPAMIHAVINNNIADYGGGMYNHELSSPSLTDVTINDNRANAEGGGMYNRNSSPTLNRVTIIKNSSYHGGGMYNLNSSVSLNYVTVDNNTSTSGNGGGILNQESSPVLNNVIISNNTSKERGGGVYNDTSSPVFTDVTINNNTSGRGGGMYNIESFPELTQVIINDNSAVLGDGGGMSNYKSSPQLTNVKILDNASVAYGGGIVNIESSTVLTDVTISGNTGVAGGGGIYNINGSNPVLTGVTISGNTTGDDGGGIANFSSSPLLTNVRISGNKASNDGGGMYNVESSPKLTNVTISGNTASNNNGGIRNFNSSAPQIRNTIIWGNTQKNGSDVGNVNSVPVYAYSLVSGESVNNGIILNKNPLFVDTAAGDYSLQQASPCIDAGSNTFYASGTTPDLSHITTDIAGNPRFFSGTVDLGAYEYIVRVDIHKRLYVNANSTGTADGSSWSNAMPQLADALEYAGQNSGIVEEIWVASGTYKPLHMAGNGTTERDKAFVLTKNLKLYGGFPNIGNPTMSNRDWESNKTILSGDIGTPANKTDNCFHVLIAAGNIESVLLDGFSITGGCAGTEGTTTVNGYTVQKNYCGGIFISIASGNMVEIQNCYFYDNESPSYAGAIYATGGKITVSNTKIANNRALYGSGLLIAGSSSSRVDRCYFTGNTATSLGGAVHGSGEILMTNSLLTGNKSTNGGAFDFYGDATLVNLTIANNTATGTGGGVYVRAGQVKLQNTIFYNNTAGSNGTIARAGGSVSLNNCALQDATIPTGLADRGNNILDANPLFADAANGDFSLLQGSPCINAGDNSLYLAIRNSSDFTNEVDLRGTQRLAGVNIDMGAYEYLTAHTVAFNSNGGTAITPVQAAHGTTISEPAESVKTGYIFKGWYKEANCINRWVFTTDVVLSDITLYAKWDKDVSISEINGITLKLYPNPVSSILYVESPATVQSVVVYDALGRIVNQYGGVEKIDMSGFTKGVYFVRIQTAECQATKKILKE